MGQGLRYNIQHIGDVFVDNLERAFDCVKSSTRGITLTYDIHLLKDGQAQKFTGALARSAGVSEVVLIVSKNDIDY